jgi:hypothetical protein
MPVPEPVIEAVKIDVAEFSAQVVFVPFLKVYVIAPDPDPPRGLR